MLPIPSKHSSPEHVNSVKWGGTEAKMVDHIVAYIVCAVMFIVFLWAYLDLRNQQR